MRRELLMAEFLSTPWALEPGYLAAFASVLQRWQGRDQPSADVRTAVAGDAAIMAARKQEIAATPRVGQAGNIAVLPLYGVLTQRGNMANELSGSGATSLQQFTQALRAALRDPEIDGVLVEIDSPGGSVYGLDELASEILASRGTKPIVGLANSIAASGGYWVGAACSELYVVPGGEVGSVGVFTGHDDLSEALKKSGVKKTFISAGKFKVEGNPYEPLSAEAQAHMQQRVDEYYDAFTKTVARGREVPVARVLRDFGQGRVLGANQALTAGMVNGVATFDQVVQKMGRNIKSTGRMNGTNRSAPRLAHALRTLEIEKLVEPRVVARPATAAQRYLDSLK